MALSGQEQPLSIWGTFSTGYYSTKTRGDENQSLNFVPFGARFDVNGYLLSPDLLTFTVQPELNAGPQASDAGFQGGNGVRLSTTLFRRLLPITFHYSNVQVEDVYFGSLTQVSGYTLKDRTKDMGVTVELKRKNWPSAVIDWGTGSVDATPGIAGIPDYLSRGHHVNVDGDYERGGWTFDGFFHDQYQRSDLLASTGSGTDYGSLQQKVLQYEGSVRRGFLGDSEFFMDGGSQTTSSLLFNFPIDLGTRYVSANLRLMQHHRWRSTLRAGYSSNVASQLLAQATSSLGAAGSAAPDAQILTPFSHGVANYILTANTNVTLGGGFGLYGGVERSALFSDNTDSTLSANYFTSSAGVTWAKRFSWGNISGEYGREFGIGSITGQSGTIQGQTYRASVQHGTGGRLQLDLTLHGSDQSILNAQPLTNDSVSVEGGVGTRVYRDFSARLGGGWQWSSIVNDANEFRTNGYTARAGIDHPRFQVDASINNALSNSLPFYTQVVSALGGEAAFLTPSQIIPSDYRAMTFSLHTTPLRKVELSGQWTRSKQHLDGFLNNEFDLLNLYLTYHFRKIQVEAGYIRAIEIFSTYPLTLRERFYVRIVRPARLL
ncbi:MAG: hypothetical protein P4L56_17925 [Candidatus Sulfopaludibacter sp.]|nr:hypothetical protein [Candidatus Sulfopaludibacter sp.]